MDFLSKTTYTMATVMFVATLFVGVYASEFAPLMCGILIGYVFGLVRSGQDFDRVMAARLRARNSLSRSQDEN